MASDPSTAVTVPMAPGEPDYQAPRPVGVSPWPLAFKVALGVTATSTLIMWMLDRRYMKKAAEEAKKTAETPVAEIVKSGSPAGVRATLPKGVEYLADVAFELAPKYDVSPYTILAITKNESGFGQALKPQGPSGTGDFIPRDAGKCVARDLKGDCTKTLADLVKELAFPVARIQKKGKTFLKPTERGWGHGLYQLDLQSNIAFIASGQWSDAKAAMEYALKVFTTSRDKIKKAIPSLPPAGLLQASIAAYNAGYPKVIKALKAGVPPNRLDQGKTRVTYGPDYVTKILNDQAKLSDAGKVA